MRKKTHRQYTRWVRKLNKGLATDSWDKIRGRFYVREQFFSPQYNAIVYELIDKKTGKVEEYLMRDAKSYLIQWRLDDLWWEMNDFILNVRREEKW